MKLFYFAVKRLSRLLITVYIISTAVFFIVRVIPGDPALVIAGIDATQEDINIIRDKLDAGDSLWMQYIRWLGNVIRFDFGKSLFTEQDVIGLILERFPLTLSLAIMGILFSFIVAIPLGVLSAFRRGSVWDYISIGFTQIGMAVPSFWMGILLLLILAVELPIFPLFGSGTPIHLILPAVSLGIARAAILTRIVRISMLDELAKEYVITAKSKGLTDRMIKYKHVLRNALLPVLTVSGIQLGALLGGSIIIEQVFSLPGLGRLFLFAVFKRDFPLIQGGVVFIAIMFSLINFLVDTFYHLINPKIRIH